MLPKLYIAVAVALYFNIQNLTKLWARAVYVFHYMIVLLKDGYK